VQHYAWLRVLSPLHSFITKNTRTVRHKLQASRHSATELNTVPPRREWAKQVLVHLWKEGAAATPVGKSHTQSTLGGIRDVSHVVSTPRNSAISAQCCTLIPCHFHSHPTCDKYTATFLSSSTNRIIIIFYLLAIVFRKQLCCYKNWEYS